MERMAEGLARYLTGRIGYFGKCENPKRAAEPRGVDQASTLVGDLEAVETESGAIR